MNSPAISVVIPYFNRAATLPRPPLGPDPERVQGGDPRRRRLFLGAAARGPGRRREGRAPPREPRSGHARNRGAELAAHPIVAFLDADDEWFPDKISRQLKLLQPGVCVAGGVLKQNDGSGDVIEMLPPTDDPGDWVLRGNPISPSTLLIHLDDHATFGGFPEDRECAEDWVYIGRLLKAGLGLATIGDFVAMMHRDGRTTTSDPDVAVGHALGAARLFGEERLVDEPGLRLMQALAHLTAAQVRANSGAWTAALKHSAHALAAAPIREVAAGIATVPVAGIRGSLRRRVPEPPLNPARPAPRDPCVAGIDATGKRLAVVVPDTRVPAWMNQVIEDLSSATLEVALCGELRTGLGLSSDRASGSSSLTASAEPVSPTRCVSVRSRRSRADRSVSGRPTPGRMIRRVSSISAGTPASRRPARGRRFIAFASAQRAPLSRGMDS